MRRSLALLVPAVLLAAACAQSPTAADRRPVARFGGGNTMGSGNVVGGGGNTMGSGNAAGSGSESSATAAGATANDEDGGIFAGDGSIMNTGPNTSMADSAETTERGGNYFGSGN